ncbi:selenocysteine-specific translation elongation factor [Allochromatium vinosum]|uniref:Selenocysteine-specific translation elongation factor n=1 Tax=Allochromatium vinosum (strain ATCC 17899 / DSM 180 / NBRC 103801 / NCIMB 10441 / D) TaxID=572477 RepID=D3RT16_ALLVD|nr:selenocysteine-specific translation elongation factor [Allochromatium vinosum]ADC62325.1 selenocysteine-specific translation elongation factor [Allochromatium vinosum DSM 180]
MLIGTAGHIDHGKTTLVKALTGVDADRLPQEKARGITLDLGYAYTPLADGSVLGFVDVPGHEKLVHNMLAGATAIDFVLLVIAADDGPMPQTREHLELLDLLGLSRGAVALTKIDVAAPERLDAARHAVHELLAGTALATCPLFPVSGRTGDGVDALRDHLEREATAFVPPAAGGRFRLAIDRAFSLSGVGTVVTGTAHAGTVAVGETLMLAPPGLKARVRGLHVQDRPAERGQAGERCALALKGEFEKSDIRRGQWLVEPSLVLALNRVQGEVRVPASQPALRHMQSVHVHLGTEDIVGRVALLDTREVAPGERALVELLLERETLALRGDRFILRDAGAQRTVAGGRVLDIFPPTRHKRTPERLALLDRLRDDDPVVALEYLADQSTTGVDLERFALSWNLDRDAAEALWQRVGLRVIREGETVIGLRSAAWAGLRARLLDVLEQEHARAPDMIGVEPERLRRLTSVRLARPVFAALRAELLASGAIAQTRTWLHRPSHRASVSDSDRACFAAWRPLLDAKPYNPPRVRDVAKATGTPEHEVRRLFKRLARAGELYPVAHDHYFTAGAVAELAGIVRQLNVEQGAARAAPFRDILFSDGDGGRKVAIAILEFFDRIGYTRRVRDDHVLRHDSALHDLTAR